MHDLFFAKQVGLLETLREPNLGKELQRLGVDAKRLTSCMSGDVSGRVDQMSKAASSLKVTGTPTFFFGLADGPSSVRVKKRLEGAVASAEMGTIIDTLVKESASVK